ncbi:MAG: endonuclease III [bacterium]
MKVQNKADEINKILSLKYPNPKSALIWSSPWQMLVVAIFSAQTTDIIVNKVTEELFEKYPTPYDIQKAGFDELKNITKHINYSNNKTIFIIEDADITINNYSGKIPSTMEDLLKYKGVGRKVANVILGEVYNKPEGIVVDTHVKRVSYRLGLTKNSDPTKVEQDLIKIFKKQEWGNISHRLIFHGREICNARKPKCELCPLNNICDFYIKN